MTKGFEWALKTLVEFENTSIVYPWAKKPEQIIDSAEEIFKECNGEIDTDSIYDAIDKVCGVNPILKS